MLFTERKNLDGELFRQLMFGGLNGLNENIRSVNDLNVFPIPDGDTGDNMYRTLRGGVTNMQSASLTIGDQAKALADGMLLSARGNSGVILSQLFCGLARGLSGLESADIMQLTEALRQGVKTAYSAVVQPVEGTVLTVAREAVEYAAANVDSDTDIGSFMSDMVEEMRASLARTPELLDVLKQAGVIDSGGAGLLYIFAGMRDALSASNPMQIHDNIDPRDAEIDYSKFDANTTMVYGYCTELLLQLQYSKTDAENFDVAVIINYLNTIGDSIVAFRTGTIVKVHVHTMTPSKVLEFCQQYGEFLTVKIENMTLQHNGTQSKQDILPKADKPRKKYGVCVVATGQGLADTFREMGADYVIEGGQGKNPSISQFISAFDDINADHIFVLPNNGNIYLAAKQAAEIYNGSDVRVAPVKSFGQGYAALSMLDYSSDNADEIAATIVENAASAKTGLVTVAIRDAGIHGVNIHKGEYIGMGDGDVCVTNSSETMTCLELVQKLRGDENCIALCVYGNVSEEDKQSIRDGMVAQFADMEFYEIDGGQEVYDYIWIIQ